jgi:hypothetical protein
MSEAISGVMLNVPDVASLIRATLADAAQSYPEEVIRIMAYRGITVTVHSIHCWAPCGFATGFRELRALSP